MAQKVISQSLMAALTQFAAQAENAPNRVEIKVKDYSKPLDVSHINFNNIEGIDWTAPNRGTIRKGHNRSHNRLKNKMAKASRKRNRR